VRAGEQALANVLHVAELGRQYEASGGISFRGFVETLNDQADGGQAAEAPILEEGAAGVRLMTTHKAKGLEFPVVILADITAKLKSDRADRLVDRAKNACYLRLGRWTPIELARPKTARSPATRPKACVAYVAATRAGFARGAGGRRCEWDGAGWRRSTPRFIPTQIGGARLSRRRLPHVQEGSSLAAARSRSRHNKRAWGTRRSHGPLKADLRLVTALMTHPARGRDAWRGYLVDPNHSISRSSPCPIRRNPHRRDVPERSWGRPQV
jgi:superfamily I DNA/RNA helicase